MLTRMLFGAGEPQHRFRMRERAHRPPQSLIERCCAGHSKRNGALRLLAVGDGRLAPLASRA